MNYRSRSREVLIGIATLAASALHGGAHVADLDEYRVTGWRNDVALPIMQIDRTFDGSDIANINTVTIDDAVRYAPGFGVRRRFIGDQNAPVFARGSNTMQSARSLVMIDDMPVSNPLGSGHGFAPRWELISPTEVDSVSTLNGPFSSLYSGNTLAAGIFIVSRPPRPDEGYISGSFFLQEFKAFGTDDTYPGFAVNAGYDFAVSESLSLSVHAGYSANQAQPQSFESVAVSATVDADDDAGTSVGGAFRKTDARGTERFVFGSRGRVETERTLVRVRSHWEPFEGAQVVANIGYWYNTDETDRPETYLRDSATGAAVNEGRVSFDGRSWEVGANNFRRDLIRRENLLAGVSVRLSGSANLEHLATASWMETLSMQRRQSGDLPTVTAVGGSGRLATVPDQGWRHLAYRGRIFFGDSVDVIEELRFGASFDHMRTEDEMRSLSDWRVSNDGPLTQRNTGKSRLGGVYAEGEGAFSDSLGWRLGVRGEEWRAYGGSRTQQVGGSFATDRYPSRKENAFSPRAALVWEPAEAWEMELAAARATRFPTVGELFSGQLDAAGLISRADPNLKAEVMQATKLTLRRDFEGGHAALTMFVDRERDTLYRQGDVFTGITSFQNIPRVRTRGVELRHDSRALFDGRLDLYASVMYLDSRILRNPSQPDSEGRFFPRVPRWRIRGLATYHVTDSLAWTVGLRHDGTQFNQLDNSDGGRGGLGNVDSFLLIDTRVRYSPSDRITVGAGIDNLTNQLHWVGHPYPRRTFFTDVRFTF